MLSFKGSGIFCIGWRCNEAGRCNNGIVAKRAHTFQTAGVYMFCQSSRRCSAGTCFRNYALRRVNGLFSEHLIFCLIWARFNVAALQGSGIFCIGWRCNEVGRCNDAIGHALIFNAFEMIFLFFHIELNTRSVSHCFELNGKITCTTKPE